VTCMSLPSYHIARKDFSEDMTSQFPWTDGFELDRDLPHVSAQAIIETLGPMISEERKDRIQSVVSSRCFGVLPVIENPYDFGNVAAVCRSADALGFGALHVIRRKDKDKYKQSTRTSGGSDKWLDIRLHNGTEECLTELKARGFHIVATCLGTDEKKAKRPDEIDWTVPTAIVFGNELEGVSETVVDMADSICEIPIDGFVESYNISVAASLIFWEARRIRTENMGKHGDLTNEEQEILRAIFYLRNKGVFKQYASALLKRQPPEWQKHRGSWLGKEFLPEEDEVEALRDSAFIRKQQAKNVTCHLWDGTTCYGEKHLYSGHKTCRFAAGHIPNRNTLDIESLKKQCTRYGKEMPSVFETTQSSVQS